MTQLQLQRLPDWEARLHDYLAAHEGAVFEWGVIDCALFAAGAVEAQTGVDFAAPFRGHYSTAIGSARALGRYGERTLEATIAARFPATPAPYARRGDLVMVESMAGVCIGGDAVFVGEEDGAPGLVRFARPTWSHAWAIG